MPLSDVPVGGHRGRTRRRGTGDSTRRPVQLSVAIVLHAIAEYALLSNCRTGALLNTTSRISGPATKDLLPPRLYPPADARDRPHGSCPFGGADVEVLDGVRRNAAPGPAVGAGR
jgi:hypothetical protein